MESISSQTLRIIDANLNRIGEGLRVLEEVARLLLDDAALTEQLKNMRHEMLRVDLPLQQRFVQARDSVGDVGVDLEVPGDVKHRELPATVVANARRVQEALRVMEELAKTPGTALDSEKFKQARFGLYTIEKALLARLLRRDRVAKLTGLYVVIDTEALKGRSHVEVAGAAIRGGAKIIQLRDKVYSKKEIIPAARELRSLCAAHDVLFIINDYLDLALASDADGLHLGQDDLPVSVARRLLPVDKIVGVSVRTVEQALIAQSDGADYIAVASMYPTTSKEMEEVVGPERLFQIKQAVTLPVVAIGGIKRDNVAQVMAAGADSAAVISAVLGADNPEEATRQIVDRIKGERND